jgi:hypothetical protein
MLACGCLCFYLDIGLQLVRLRRLAYPADGEGYMLGCPQNKDPRHRTQDLQNQDPYYKTKTLLQNQDLQKQDPPTTKPKPTKTRPLLQNQDLQNQDPLQNQDLQKQDPLLQNQDLQKQDPYYKTKTYKNKTPTTKPRPTKTRPLLQNQDPLTKSQLSCFQPESFLLIQASYRFVLHPHYKTKDCGIFRNR